MLNTLDLFAGIGGFSLGLERTGGFRTVAFCEIDKKAQRVLNKHWPDTPIFDDVSALTKDLLDETVGVPVHVITGGFPCQDLSTAGRGAGLEGERSSLWFQLLRLIDEIRPRYAIIENVSALRSRGLEVVLQGINAVGYRAEWHCIPASFLGAHHQRDRIWIVAYPDSSLEQGDGLPSGVHAQNARAWVGGSETVSLADTQRIGLSGSGELEQPSYPAPLVDWKAVESFYGRVGQIWGAEPDVGRVAHGIPNRVDRLKQLGNAVVPQIPQLLGEAILDWEKARVAA